VKLFINVALSILGVLFMIAAFKTRGFVSRGWRKGDPIIAPTTTAGRVILFLAGVSALLAAIGVLSK
jgi:hypothetical protein